MTTGPGRPAVVTQGLSKRYVIGERQGFPTLRDRVVEMATAPVRRVRGGGRAPAEEIWALRDVSVTIPAGDAVGFVGRNGAGKSTLLKVISRITAPTGGSAEVTGRVGALLEVGTGFHPELTGRENVYLNGAVLGMTRQETRRKLEAIVDFAGVEVFLDTPVKRYSSGMQVRLAFAVAAHLDPEVFIVDEVLAVGDAEFQRKCLGKMGEFARDGRTVIFVSHNMAVLQTLCNRAIYLHGGRVVDDGPVRTVVDSYLASLEEAVTADLRERPDRDSRGYQIVLLQGIRVTGASGEGVATGRPMRVEIYLDGVLQRPSCRFVIHDSRGVPVASFDSDVRAPHDTLTSDHQCYVCEIADLSLVPGRYRIDVIVRGDGHIQDGLEAATFFDVEPGMFDDRAIRSEGTDGSVVMAHRWSTIDTGGAE